MSTVPNTVPNLDCLEPRELIAFWTKYHRPIRKDCIQLLGVRFPGYIRVARDLAEYAANRAVASDCRVRGDIPTAQLYDAICDRIYEEIPEPYRW